MQKICFFNSTRAWGGGEKWHFEMADALHKQGHDILFVTGKGSELIKKLSTTSIPFTTFKINKLSFLNFILLLRLKSFFKNNKIDTLIINLSIDLKVAGMAGKWAGVPRIIYRRGSAIPIKNKPFNRYLFKKVITDVIANSEATKYTILQNNSGLFPLEKIRVIYNGLNLKTAGISTNKALYYQKQSNEIVLGNAGRMVYQKGHEYLVEIAACLKNKGIDFKLILAGTGPLEEKVKAKVSKLGLTEQVVFLGFADDINLFMRTIDIFLLTSRWEGFGFVLAEAMIESKPMVAFDISSNPELVVDGKNGFLVKPFDIEGFAQKTIELIHSKELRQEFGEYGNKLVNKKFTFERAVLEVKDMLGLQ